MTSANILVPAAPAFLDPLIEIESCYYYAVPRFFGFHHPNTRWLIAMIKAKEEDRVKRKIELNPELFKGRYFQMVDHPRLYLPDDPSVTPMFKRQSVLYLSALGISIYLRSLPLIELILFHKDPYGAVVGSPYEPQFASHLQDMKYGDFHAFPPSIIMLRMYCFEATVSLQQAGWNPTQALALPMRRKYERRAFYFYDWLEAALGLLSERPLYPLQSLILNMTRNMTIYKFLMLPTVNLLPPTPKQRVLTGLIDVEELPVGTKMIGVRSLLEMAEDYDRYLQMRSCAVEVATLKREATAVGLNPEILMIQAQDYDGYVADKEAAEENENNAATAALRNASNVANAAASVSGWWRASGLGRPQLPDRLWAVEPDTRQQRLLAVNANNSATNAGSASNADSHSQRNVSAASKKKKKSRNYVSEALRVLYYALEKDKTSKRMQVCLDSIIVLSKRGFFVNGERQPADSPRARDLRNVVVLVLNMIQREQEKLDVIFAKIQSGYKKFQHLEEHKMLENRRLASVANISKMISVLTRILLHSKELVFFVSSNFPPFPANTVDFTVNYRLQTKFNDIKGGVVQEFNSIKDGWTFLSKEMLEEVAKIKSMQLHFRVGKQPSAAAIIEAKKAARKSAMRNKPKNKSNMSNTNSCFVTFRKVQRIRAQQRQREIPVGEVTKIAANEETQLSPREVPNCIGESDNRWWTSPLPQSQTTATAVAVGTDVSDTVAADANEVSERAISDTIDDSECYEADGAVGAGLDEEAQLLHDLTDGCDGLSETGLLMSNLYREVQGLLKSQSEADSSATRTPRTKASKGGDEDTATIEPKPGTGERLSLNQSSCGGRQPNCPSPFGW